MRPFWEYAGVQRRTKDLARLMLLHSVRLDQAQARALVATLSKRFGIGPVNLQFTARTDRGWFGWDERVLRVRSHDISTEVLLHELAHGWSQEVMNRNGLKFVNHGEVFIDCLDRLAEATTAMLDNGEATGIMGEGNERKDSHEYQSQHSR